LIAVSAYVANLAAFLTQTRAAETSVNSMKEVIDKNMPICGHQALEANWIFDSYDGMFEAYAREECKVLAMGREHAFMNIEFLERVCKHDLVYTDVLIHENPIAFPIRPELASAFSYWMHTAEKSHGVSLESEKQAYFEKHKIRETCEIELSNLNKPEADDFARVSTMNMFLPIMAFVICVLIAVVLQLIHENEKKKGRTSAFGRKSTLGISWLRGTHAASDEERGDVQRKGWDKKVDEDESEMPRTLDKDDSEIPRSKSIVRRSVAVAHDKSDAGIHAGGNDEKRGQMCDCPGANIPGDEFYENGAP